MATQSFIAGTGATANDGSVRWSNPGNITANDNTSASTLGTRNSTINGDSLRGTNYGFSIPAGSTINGITFEIEWDATYNGVDNMINPIDLRLMKAGAAVGTSKHTSVSVPTTATVQTYGSASDLWGTTWTAADINATNFGVEFQLELGEFANTNATRPSARVDYFKVTVDYTEPAPTSTGNMMMMFYP